MSNITYWLHQEVSSAWAYFLAFGILFVWWALAKLHGK